MDAQVLLLMDPGAELGWAELSDTLPSVGREREDNRHEHSSSHRNNLAFWLVIQWYWIHISSDYNASKNKCKH